MDAFCSRSYDVHEVTFFIILFNVFKQSAQHNATVVVGATRCSGGANTTMTTTTTRAVANSRRRNRHPRTAAAEQNSHRDGGGDGGNGDDDDGTAAEETDEESERVMRKWVIRDMSRGEERGDRRRPGELTAIRAERMTARAREDQ